MTYEFIKNVRFAERNTSFEPSVYACFLLTGHESMNKFLCDRGLSDSDRCVCGAEYEYWKYVLVECDMYENLTNLNGVRVNADGRIQGELRMFL